jgi:hypothetical protein
MTDITKNITVYTDDGAELELSLPAKFEVCSRCRGTGSHVNPAVDGHGIPAHEFVEDPDFAESYFAGVYDVPCERCHGKRVVEAFDWSKLTDEQKALIIRTRREEAEYEAECAAERRMGA